jgi:hypothetical protein
MSSCNLGKANSLCTVIMAKPDIRASRIDINTEDHPRRQHVRDLDATTIRDDGTKNEQCPGWL